MLETSDPEVRVQAKELDLSPTPPLPEDLPTIELAENARTVLMKRYVRRQADGEPGETVDEMPAGPPATADRGLLQILGSECPESACEQGRRCRRSGQ